MRKLIIIILIFHSGLALGKNEFGMSGITYTSVEVEDESMNSFGTILTPTAGIAHSAAHFFSSTQKILAIKRWPHMFLILIFNRL